MLPLLSLVFRAECCAIAVCRMARAWAGEEAGLRTNWGGACTLLVGGVPTVVRALGWRWKMLTRGLTDVVDGTTEGCSTMEWVAVLTALLFCVSVKVD